MICTKYLYLLAVQLFGGNGLRKRRTNMPTLCFKKNMMKLIKSFSYAWAGMKSCFESELNFRIHLIAAIAAIIFSLMFSISATEWIAVGFCIAFVTAMEMMNTAIEKLCDMVHKESHPVIKKIKDIAAGAVLLSAVFSLITAAIIFLPKIIMYFK